MDIFDHQTKLTENIVAGGPGDEISPTYSPTMTRDFAETVESTIEKHNIEVVYDLGSGDLLLPVYLAYNTSVEVVAYEISTELVEDAISFWKYVGCWDEKQITVRTTDFTKDLSDIQSTQNSLLVNCGSSNRINPSLLTAPLISSKFGHKISIHNI